MSFPWRLSVGFAVAGLACTLATSACLYTTTGPEANLTQEEIRDLFDWLTVAVTWNDSTKYGGSLSFPCRNAEHGYDSGRVHVALGSLDSQRPDESTYSYRAVPDDCEVLRYTRPDIRFTGDPAIAGDVRWSHSILPGFLHMTGLGGFRYTTEDGRKGACEIDVLYARELPTEDRDDAFSRWEGTACGLDMDYTRYDMDYTR